MNNIIYHNIIRKMGKRIKKEQEESADCKERLPMHRGLLDTQNGGSFSRQAEKDMRQAEIL